MADRWRFDCPDGCAYAIDVAVDSGTGEQAAQMMDEHMMAAHGSRFPAWLAPPDSGRIAEALGADIVEPVEDAVARGVIPHDPHQTATPDAGGPS